ncbi:hypothetical protein BDW62DRAFT_213036 [Aspergillus aurantiobrunneus]
MALPTVVLVHGAWHTSANYQSYIAALQRHGFTVHCPLLPTCNKSLSGERILMIMHSYGGTVGSDAIYGLAYPSASGGGGVIHLLYLCVFILPAETSVWDVLRAVGYDSLFDQFVHTAEDGSMFPLDPGMLFFGGDDTMVRFPRSACTTPVGEANAWKAVPGTYVRTEKDYSLLPAYQEVMLSWVKEHGADLRIESYGTCHSIFASKEEDMVRLAVEAAEDPRDSTVL